MRRVTNSSRLDYFSNIEDFYFDRDSQEAKDNYHSIIDLIDVDRKDWVLISQIQERTTAMPTW